MMQLDLLAQPICPAAYVVVTPVIDYGVRALCTKPYPGHPRGCPNANKKDGCPPAAPLFDRHFDLTHPVYAVVNEFDLAGQVERMRKSHPGWSYRQLACCRYWQAGARKKLAGKHIKVGRELGLMNTGGWIVDTCPEAKGVNVTATLAAVGINLEWPPKRVVRQVALIAKRLP